MFQHDCFFGCNFSLFLFQSWREVAKNTKKQQEDSTSPNFEKTALVLKTVADLKKNNNKKLLSKVTKNY